MAPTLSKFGISVSIVEPGPVATNFTARAQGDMAASDTPKDDIYT
jgi:short-subunit dehydrogenase